jgi:hypothetical protein
MKQRRQLAPTPSSGKPALATKASRTSPIQLDETALKQVAGGLKTLVTNTPRGTW